MVKKMTNITINTKNNTIVITKAFSKKASRFESPEYKALQRARTDYPSFKVEVRAASKKKESFKGLTYAYMEKYIANHDDDNQTIMREYEMLRGISAEAEELMAEAVSYGEMKEWFLNKFPEIRAFHEKRAMMLAA